MFFFKSKKLIGLDIGTANIKMAEVEMSRNRSTLLNFAIVPTPPRAINGGEVVDPAAISDAIKNLVLQLRSKRKAVAVGLWGTSVITKRISIPRMDENLVAGQIRWEAEQYIPFDINEVNIDFSVLKNFKSSADTMDVLLVAARQDVAALYQDIVQSVGLQCAVVDVAGFALANCFMSTVGGQSSQAVAVMNMGASVTNFTVLERGEVVFCRDIPVGGLSYTTEIHKNMGMSLEEAEAMKISACTGQAAPEEVNNLIQATHESVAEEIQSSFDFFVNTTPGLEISHCYITGGAARTPGLIKYLSEHVKLNFDPFDPFRGMQMSSSLSPDYISDIRDFAAISTGLAMRALGDG